MSRSFYFLFPPKKLPDAPKIGQRVRIEGQPGTYIVLHFDTRRMTADLMSTSGQHEIEEKVPFFAIEPLANESSAQESAPARVTR
ncbi:hypothetical protein DYQ86_02905 [Acidobacteria bacterium AB60]|nr:hypothetical protein DYQ86_02905 [Acidobacteria bacterium AB60]